MISDVYKDAASIYRKLGWLAPDAILLRKRLEIKKANLAFERDRERPWVIEDFCIAHF